MASQEIKDKWHADPKNRKLGIFVLTKKISELLYLSG